MKNKHTNNEFDSALLFQIQEAVKKNLQLKSGRVRTLICLKFIFYFSSAALLYFFLFKQTNPLAFCLVYISFGFALILFAFNFAHDFSHNTIFKSKFWNNAGYTLIYTLVGAHAESWKHRHIHSHHFAPNVEGHDSDLKISKLIRVIPNSKSYWFNHFQHIYAPITYMSYSLFWIFIKDSYLLFSEESKPHNKRFLYHLSFWLQKTFYITFIVILPILFSKQPFLIVLLGFLFMHIVQSLFLLLTFFITHHVETSIYPTLKSEGTIDCSWLMNQIKSSNDFYPFSKLANFIFGGFNNHIAHHLFPNTHHAYYPQLSEILYDTLKSNNIVPNQTTYFGGVKSHLKLLKAMRR